MRVGHARLLDQCGDLRQHLFSREPSTLAILIEHGQPRLRSFTLRAARRGALAKLRAFGIRRSLRCLGARNLDTNL